MDKKEDEAMNVNPFTKFEKDWALLTAGTEERYNSMTIGWEGTLLKLEINKKRLI